MINQDPTIQTNQILLKLKIKTYATETKPSETYDVKKAQELWAEGLKEEGLTLAEFSPELLCDDSSAAKQQAEFLQAQLKEHLGVTLNIRQVTYNARLDAMDQGDFEIVFAGWSPDYNDPMTYLDMWVTGNGNNHGKWSNAEYDKIIKEASQIADKEAYYAKLKEAEEILAEECPIGFIYDRQTSYVTSDRLKGVIRTAFQDINLNYAYIEEQSKVILIFFEEDGLYNIVYIAFLYFNVEKNVQKGVSLWESMY